MEKFSFTQNEQAYLERLHERLIHLRTFLNDQPLDTLDTIVQYITCIQQIRAIQGNTSNDISFVACLLAKRYLSIRFDIKPFDVAAKPQGAPGLDIDVMTQNSERIIGEIKTTVPYVGAKNDLGADQKASFQKDFTKLNEAVATYKFFFVTDRSTYDTVQRKYIHLIPDVKVILLTL